MDDLLDAGAGGNLPAIEARLADLRREVAELRQMIAELAVAQAETANALSSMCKLLARQERAVAAGGAYPSFRSHISDQEKTVTAIGATALELAAKAGIP